MYGYLGSMRTKPGHRDEVVAILVGAADGLRNAGCRSYIVHLDDDEPDRIWVNEVWDSRELHDASLRLPQAVEAIQQAMPMLTGEFDGRHTVVAGGLGA